MAKSDYLSAEPSQTKHALRSLFSLQESRSLSDVGLLALRVVVGFAFLARGMQVFGWFGGMTTPDGSPLTGVRAIEDQALFLEFVGFQPALALSWLLVSTQLAAGVLLIAGFLTPLGAAAAIGHMFNVVFGLSWQMGWFGNENGPGYEFAAVLLVAAVTISLAGPGRYSADRGLGWRLSGVPWGVFGIMLGLAVGFVVLVALGPGLGPDIPAPPAP